MTILNLARLISLLVVFSIFASGQEKDETIANKQVLLNVTIVNRDEEPVKDLKAENFRLYEGKKPLEISYFSNENDPISVGFLIDVSPSMGGYADLGRKGILALLEKSNSKNEYFVVAFGEKVELLSNFADLTQTMKVVSASPYFSKKQEGQTAFYDAVALGIDNLSKAKNQKRVLFIFGDGTDSKSSKTYKEIEKIIKEKNIIVYFVGFGDKENYAYGSTPDKMARVSGGTAIYPRFASIGGGVSLYRSKLLPRDEVFIRNLLIFADQLQNQYVIGFKPIFSDNDNKWRSLEIKLEIQKELRKKIGTIHIRHREGYYPISEIVIGK